MLVTYQDCSLQVKSQLYNLATRVADDNLWRLSKNQTPEFLLKDNKGFFCNGFYFPYCTSKFTQIE